MGVNLELIHVVLEPTRFKILEALLETRRYISQLAEKTTIDRSTISFHLGVLEKAGLVQSEYKVLVQPKSKGKAARVYTINHKRLDEALDEVGKLVPLLKRD